MIPEIVICLIVGYCFGCFSTGYFYGKTQNVDVRQHGSGNIGSTNTLRTLGVKAGIITLLGDVFKCLLPCAVLSILFKGKALSYDLIIGYTGLGVVLGHNFPFWLKFKGGKGIAAMSGVIIMFSLKLTLIDIIIFVSIVALTRYVSLGSLIVSLSLPIYAAIVCRGASDYIHIIIVYCMFTILAFYKHRSNIARLVSGTENKIGQKAS
ncbi:MAG: glycerol-3-phosphate 1-O-acyltransferase PlsY [bacterium]|nr:glycerol-3-phosphate 1-O-acyltransferase PlsY [bacterium]